MLKQAAGASDAPTSKQLRAHRQAMLQLLYERLQGASVVSDARRGVRLQRAVDARERKLGVASAFAAEVTQCHPVSTSQSTSIMRLITDSPPPTPHTGGIAFPGMGGECKQ